MISYLYWILPLVVILIYGIYLILKPITQAEEDSVKYRDDKNIEEMLENGEISQREYDEIKEMFEK